MKKTLLLATLALSHDAAQAAITVTNLGNTTPTGFTTGNTTIDPHITLAGSPEVFGFRNGNTHGQTFTVASAITLQKIFIGYGSLMPTGTAIANSTTISLTVDEGNNASNEITESFTLTTASITQDPTAPYAGIHWLELDVSSSSLALAAGTHSFRLTVTATAGSGTPANRWLLAPTYTGTAGYLGADYTGGNLSGTAFAGGFPNRDTNFAISGTAVPEPASLALLGLGALPLLRRRRA